MPTGHVGATGGNRAAVKWGLKAKFHPSLAGTKEARNFGLQLAQDCNADTAAQRALVKLAIEKYWRCGRYLEKIMHLEANGQDVPEWMDLNYLRFAKSLEDTLVKLGLERKARDVETLQSYLARKQNQQGRS